MEILIGDQSEQMDQALCERVNPVFKTAGTTVFALAGAGDLDARELVKAMNLTREEMLTSERAAATQENELLNEVVVETRFKTIGNIARDSHMATVVDLPCGYTPRGIQMARENRRYVGLDLPASIAQSEKVFQSIIDEEKRHLVRYASCDATNYESLKKALSGVEGEVCICTEGLMMYFTDSEMGSLCDNVRAVLMEHGGCWVSADPEVSIQYGLTLRTLFPQAMEKLKQNGQKNMEDKADVRISPPELLVMPTGDVAANMKKAMLFLAKHGLKAQRLIVSEHMGSLKSLEKLSQEQAEKYRQAMKNVAFWKITLAEQKMGKEEKVEGIVFAVTMQRDGRELMVKLSGRVDTLSAPQVLSLFEEEIKKGECDLVRVDCSDLEYISSAGLRVLLIMHKNAKNGILLKEMNPLLREIISQTGFEDIFGID